ncbi:hypothetical protein RLV_1562 (plasmid) [Rhizobium leguminosarum bv. viciae]|nr:hypothetical protein RLV_1562 [Rhizobium leguminosarum bv. viciae]
MVRHPCHKTNTDESHILRHVPGLSMSRKTVPRFCDNDMRNNKDPKRDKRI